MNLYLVVSEEIEDIEWEDWFNGTGHLENYRIAELVVARSHAQARYLAWKQDDAGTTWPLIEDMPKFAVRLKRRNTPGPARVASTEHWADSDAELDELWDVGKAPHIGYI